MKIKQLEKEIKIINRLALHKLSLQFSDQMFGYFWALVNPLVYIFCYWFFSYVGLRGGATVGEIPYVVWFIPGVLAFRYFSVILSQSTTMLINNSMIIKETRVRLGVVPLIEVIKEVYIHIAVMVFMIFFFAIVGYTMTDKWDYLPSIYYLNFVYYLFVATTFSVVLAYIFSAIGLLFRDTKNLMNAILMPLFWTTPVLFPVENGIKPYLEIAEKLVNPVYYFVDAYRQTMIYHQFFYTQPLYNAYIWIIIGILAIVAYRLWKFIYPIAYEML